MKRLLMLSVLSGPGFLAFCARETSSQTNEANELVDEAEALDASAEVGDASSISFFDQATAIISKAYDDLDPRHLRIAARKLAHDGHDSAARTFTQAADDKAAGLPNPFADARPLTRDGDTTNGLELMKALGFLGVPVDEWDEDEDYEYNSAPRPLAPEVRAFVDHAEAIDKEIDAEAPDRIILADMDALGEEAKDLTPGQEAQAAATLSNEGYADAANAIGTEAAIRQDLESLGD